MSRTDANVWAIPYIDQPLEFWEALADRFGRHILEVYFPLDPSVIGSGRPVLPSQHLDSFLRDAPLPKCALLNAVTLPGPVDKTAVSVIEELRRLDGEFGLNGATVANPMLGELVKDACPDLSLTASVLMDITQPNQALMLNGVFDSLVPGAGAMRNLKSLRTLGKAFRGRIRLLVNESCLCGCPYRPQHFHEMGTGVAEPQSFCDRLLVREPWMRLTGAWVTPQYLHMFDGCYQELKLAGRITLAYPEKYLRVLGSYIHRTPLLPREIGGGPASVLEAIDMPEDLYRYTLQCGQECHRCRRCEHYYKKATSHRKQLHLVSV